MGNQRETRFVPAPTELSWDPGLYRLPFLPGSPSTRPLQDMGCGVDHPRAGAWCVKPPCVLGPRGIGEHRSGRAKPLLGGGGAGPSSSSTKPWRGEFEDDVNEGVGVKSRDGQRSSKNNIAPLPPWPVPLSLTEQTWPQGAGCVAPAWRLSLVLSPSNLT